MKILQTWVSSRWWRPEPLYKVKSLTWKYWSLFSSLAKHCTILLTGETPNLGPKRYFPALRVWGGTTRPTKLGSKWSVEIMPEVLAAVETPKKEFILQSWIRSLRKKKYLFFNCLLKIDREWSWFSQCFRSWKKINTSIFRNIGEKD